MGLIDTAPFRMCSLSNSETLEDIFLKLGTNIKGHQMMCRERLLNSIYSFHIIMHPW